MIIRVSPRDPLVARDGRPFGVGSGNKMRLLPWPYPSLLAGAFRHLAGTVAGAFDPELLKRIGVQGPLLEEKGSLCFAWPRDLVMDKDGNLHALAPMALDSGGEVSNLPLGMMPCGNPKIGGKVEVVPPFLTADGMTDWLSGADVEPAQYRLGPAMMERTHVALNRERRAAEESMLFTTGGSEFGQAQSLSLRIRATGADADQQAQAAGRLRRIHTLGGERRLAVWERPQAAPSWECPAKVKNALKGAKHLRMVLATPANWDGGWLPQWLSQGKGNIPGTNVEVRLRGACLDRWLPVSGWSYETARFGPKAIRRLVPAGSVYFLEVVRGEAEALAAKWLEPVGDGEEETQMMRDGFGLALWGPWRQ